jgi:hypothetical protein
MNSLNTHEISLTECPAWDGKQVHVQAEDWKILGEAKRDAAFKKLGICWFEFARLEYFDPVRMTLINPMHNLLMGAILVLLHVSCQVDISLHRSDKDAVVWCMDQG